MRPLRISITGDYWDSQIYRGRLYLWDMENSVSVYDWEALIGSFENDRLRLPFVCAFSRGDLLYQPNETASILFEDSDIRGVLENKFNEVASMDISLSPRDMERYRIGIQDSPFQVLHDDLTIYNSTIYALTDSGLYMAEAHKPRSQKQKIQKHSSKLWDGIGISLQAGVSALAIAAADDGLFEYRFRDGLEPKNISSNHTLFANWSFASIYGSSDIEPGYLAAYKWERQDIPSNNLEANNDLSNNYAPKDRFIREFSRIYNEDRIFNKSIVTGKTLSWGAQEKMYRANSEGIDIVKFTQGNVGKEKQDTSPFESIGSFNMSEHKATTKREIVSAGISYFGIVVEYDDGLFVIESSGQTTYIEGPITRWRTFLRSIRYENHLHVIKDDRVEIFSFNNDYFVNQKNKTIGVEHRQKDKLNKATLN